MEGEDQEDGLLDAARFMRVSEGLRAAYARIGQTEMEAAAKERWHRRLIAITNVAKRDLTRAEEQLERFHADFTERTG